MSNDRIFLLHRPTNTAIRIAKWWGDSAAFREESDLIEGFLRDSVVRGDVERPQDWTSVFPIGEFELHNETTLPHPVERFEAIADQRHRDGICEPWCPFDHRESVPMTPEALGRAFMADTVPEPPTGVGGAQGEGGDVNGPCSACGPGVPAFEFLACPRCGATVCDRCAQLGHLDLARGPPFCGPPREPTTEEVAREAVALLAEHATARHTMEFLNDWSRRRDALLGSLPASFRPAMSEERPQAPHSASPASPESREETEG